MKAGELTTEDTESTEKELFTISCAIQCSVQSLTLPEAFKPPLKPIQQFC